MIDYTKRVRLVAAADAALALLVSLGLILSPTSSGSKESRRDLLDDASAVTSIRISGGEPVELVKTGTGWEAVDGDAWLPVDSSRVAAFLKAVDSIERAELVAEDASSQPALGLGAGARKVTLLGEGGKELCAFALGSYASSPGTVYISIGDGPESYAVASGMASYALGRRSSWLDLRAWSSPPTPDDVEEVLLRGSLDGAGGTAVSLDYTIARSGKGWMSGGEALDAMKVDAMIRAIAALRGDDYADADEPAGNAVVELELRLGNGRTLNLAVEPARADGRYPARSSQRERGMYLPAWSLTEALKPIGELRP